MPAANRAAIVVIVAVGWLGSALAWPPATLVGSIGRAGDVDYYRFEAKAGQEVGVQALAAAAGAKLDPVLVLTDASRWLATALRFWDLLATIVHALAQPLAVPRVLGVLIVALLASSLAFHFLRGQITSATQLPARGL